jgi:hypothetical protein
MSRVSAGLAISERLIMGHIYVLFDGFAGRCKIGRTRQAGRRRQQSIMASHPNKVLNLLNAEVEDEVAAETQCHQHFSSRRVNGEWFAITPDEAISYIHANIDWTKLDFEPPFEVMRYIVGCRLNQAA